MTRAIFQHVLDTRYQILIFWVLAVGLEVNGVRERQASLKKVLANGAAATIAMTVTRIIIEGVPLRLTHCLEFFQ